MTDTSAILLMCACAVLVHAGTYTNRFTEQYKKIKNSASGYFSKEGVPYHNLETLQVESTDYGHETDSEAHSYYLYLEAINGEINGDFSGFNTAWNVIESYMIPKFQASQDKYNPNNVGSGFGIDPIFQELKNTYGTSQLYLMHWLCDVDNRYGFGNLNGQCELGPSANGPSLVNNGPGSVFQGITYPTCDLFKYGSPTNGFNWYGGNTPSWQYSVAPDADARCIQAAFWAGQWASKKGQLSSISETLGKASKMGDYLRYALFDKHFKKVGYCESNCPAGTGKESYHYLLSWYVGFGGSIDSNGYAWHQGSSEAHSGYQNPMTAYALVNDANLKPKSATGVEDWKKSLAKQLAFYKYAQSPSGAFAGGVTNSYNDDYETPPAQIAQNSFDGMWYKEQPGYQGASNWYGMQSWSADRVAQYYYLTGDATAQAVMEKWVYWIKQHIKITSNGFQVPQSLSYSGTPPNVQVTVSNYGTSVGLASSTARTLAYYAAKRGDNEAKSLAKQLLDAIYQHNRDSVGVTYSETRSDYSSFNSQVYIAQQGWTGTYPNGDKITPSSRFIDIRSWYKQDPEWYKVEQYLNGGAAPVFTYHRFWEQCDYALAVGAYGLLFNE